MGNSVSQPSSNSTKTHSPTKVNLPPLADTDRHLIGNSPVTIYDIENAKEEDLLVLFLRVNRQGVLVDKSHIESVAARLAEIQSEKISG